MKKKAGGACQLCPGPPGWAAPCGPRLQGLRAEQSLVQLCCGSLLVVEVPCMPEQGDRNISFDRTCMQEEEEEEEEL